MSQTVAANGKAGPYRVVQWATGNVGSRSLRMLIEHPNMVLVGLYVYSESKAGRDAGEFCGLGPVGVKATRSIDEIIALKPDCVLYMPQYCDYDDLCKLLASGANVVTTRTEFQNPAYLDAALRARIEEACRAGASSIHGTGSSPGFVSEALPLVLTSMQRRLDRLTIREYADLSPRNSPEMIFDIMGFGRPPNPLADAGRAQYLQGSFGPSLALVAEALGLPFDSMEASGEVATAPRAIQIAAGTVEAGTVVAQRTTINGIHKGRVLISFTCNWYCSTDIDGDWGLRPDGWNVLVEGDTPMDVDIRFPVSAERWPLVSPGLTAHPAVNAVPSVCQAAPGIRTSVDLPKIIADLRERPAA